MTLPASRRLSALIVNHKSGAFALACVEALKREWCRTRVGLDLQVVVCDNASPGDPEPELRELARRGVQVVKNPDNVGFAGGIQRALRETRGGPRDVVAVLSPDVVFLPGSIDPLMDYLEEHDACGACGPRAFLDPEGRILHPRVERATPFSELATAAGRALPRWARSEAGRRTKRTRAFWESTVPFATRRLSGGCLFLRRETLTKAGGLFDAGYPLDYEDADLCERVRAAGLEMRMIPASRIVRPWSRGSRGSRGSSASAAGDDPDRPEPGWAASRARYLDQHFGRPARYGVASCERALRLWPRSRRDRPIHPLTDLGALEVPPWVELAAPTRFVIELAMAPTFPSAAGLYGVGSGWTIDAGAWEWLFAGRYFARAIDVSGSDRDGDVLGAWTFVKTTKARVEPWRTGEIETELAGVLPDEVALEDVEAALPAPSSQPYGEAPVGAIDPSAGAWAATPPERAHPDPNAGPILPPDAGFDPWNGHPHGAPTAGPDPWNGEPPSATFPLDGSAWPPGLGPQPDPTPSDPGPPETGTHWLDAIDWPNDGSDGGEPTWNGGPL